MTQRSPVRIHTREQLLKQSGLDPFLAEFVSGIADEATRLISLDLQEGVDQLVVASQDGDGVVTLIPSPCSYGTPREHRQSLWEASIQWAKSQGARAVDIYGPSGERERDILAELGFPITTSILPMGRETLEGYVPDDQPDIAIRQAFVESDHSQLCDLIARTLTQSLDLPESIPLRRPEGLLQSWIENRTHEETVILVAKTNSEAAGIVVATREQYDDELAGYRIHYLGVAEHHRQKGWATRLLNALFRFARERHIERFATNVDERNHPAIQLYQRMGFRVFEEFRYPIVFQRLEQTT